MNRQEAILWFEQMLYYLADDEWNKDARAAVSVALDALCSPWVKTSDRMPEPPGEEVEGCLHITIKD